MANYNLTSQQLKDTYEQLAQVNDSNVLVDGLGVASPIVTSSIINFPTEVSRSAAAAGFGQGGGTATWPVSGTPSGILSSSAQIATEISGAFTSTSASLAAGIATNKSDITTKLNTSTFTSYSSSVSTRLTTDESNISTNTSNIATQTSRVDSLVAATSSYARTNVNNSFSGTQNFVNIAVSGTASIAHVQTVTGSAVIIGEEFIILNAATPTARYAGIKIYDTGSVSATASIEWDGVQDTWILMEETGNTSNIITGPTGSRGSETFTTKNRLQKGLGYNYIGDSNISDDGTSVSVSTPFTATQITASSGFKGNLDGNATTSTSASFATTALTASSGNAFNIRTSLTLGSLVPTFVSSGSATGSLIDNIHPAIASSSAQIKHIVTLTQDQYDATSVSDDTLYVIADISGSTVFVTNLTITGQLDVSGSVSASFFSGDGSGLTNVNAVSASFATFATTAGSVTSASYAETSSFAAGNFEVSGQMFSPVFSGSIASSTSSVDFNNGNFCVLTLTGATHIANPSNIKSGTTYTLIINSGSLAASYGTSFKFAGGTAPTLSNGVDIVTMVSDGNRLFATGLANFS